LGLDTLNDLDILLAHQEIDYKKPVLYDDDVVVGVRVSRLGGSSFTMEYVIQASGDTAATGETVQVTVGEDNKPCEIPAEWREKFE
ncbi:MAG: hotdog domain-containing protein, partial [Halobacteria archaeon]|nr:hotdog domain-containing protein [Halobacteria archaeon]